MEEDLRNLCEQLPSGLCCALPALLFNDSTLCNNVGCHMAQPTLCVIGKLSDELCGLVGWWLVLGMAPPRPKPSKGREPSRKSALSQESHVKLHHSFLHEARSELTGLSNRKEGVPIELPGHGAVSFHFCLCAVIGQRP